MQNNESLNKNLVVVYFSSDLFSEPCAVSIASLFENNSEFESIHVYIVEDGISDDNKMWFKGLAEQYKRDLFFIPMPDPTDFFSDGRFTIASLGHTFGRMIIGQILPETVGKVICLDSDILVVDSLLELWNTNLDGFYMAGVDSAPGVAMMTKTLQIEPGTLYCNGGFFLFDLQSIREDQIEQRYVEYIKDIFSQGKKLGTYEEEVINKCCHPNILRLSPRYNLMTVNLVMNYDSFVKFRGAVNFYTKEEMRDAQERPAIIHAINTFYVRKRLWEKDSDSPYAEEYRMYRAKTPWAVLPQIVVRRTFKQKMMKEIWHIMPQKMSFALATIVRNEIRPRLSKKRDDE